MNTVPSDCCDAEVFSKGFVESILVNIISNSYCERGLIKMKKQDRLTGLSFSVWRSSVQPLTHTITQSLSHQRSYFPAM